MEIPIVDISKAIKKINNSNEEISKALVKFVNELSSANQNENYKDADNLKGIKTILETEVSITERAIGTIFRANELSRVQKEVKRILTITSIEKIGSQLRAMLDYLKNSALNNIVEFRGAFNETSLAYLNYQQFKETNQKLLSNKLIYNELAGLSKTCFTKYALLIIEYYKTIYKLLDLGMLSKEVKAEKISLNSLKEMIDTTIKYIDQSNAGRRPSAYTTEINYFEKHFTKVYENLNTFKKIFRNGDIILPYNLLTT